MKTHEIHQMRKVKGGCFWLPNRTMPRKESFQTISSVMYPQSKLKIFFRSNLLLKGNMIANKKQHWLVMVLFSNWGYVVSKKNHRKHRNLLQNWQISFKFCQNYILFLHYSNQYERSLFGANGASQQLDIKLYSFFAFALTKL